MTERTTSTTLVLFLLCSVVFLAMVALVMLGPLLVELAEEFNTSVAVTGQLIAATAISWAIVAPLVGPVSDTLGRRPVILSGMGLLVVGLLGSALAWDLGSLIAFRVGLAPIAPSSIATAADIFSAERRGRAIGMIAAAVGVGPALGVPAVAFLDDIGGWRLPFHVITVLTLALWAILWVWFPKSQSGQNRSFAFLSHFKEAGSSRVFWYALAANLSVVMASSGISSYLAAFLIQTHDMTTGEIALPLALAGAGVVVGTLVGGRVAENTRRLLLVSISLLGGGLLASLVFTTSASPWVTVALAFVVGGMLTMSWPVTATLIIELAGRSRATGTGLFAVSNQLGVLMGASIGGLMLALGGFSLVGMFSLGAAVAAALIVRLKVRDSAEFLERVALRKT